MIKTVLYLAGQKGHEVLKALVEQELHGTIVLVVGERDKGVVQDYYADIMELCSQSGIPHVRMRDLRSRKIPQGAVGLAVGWRLLIRTSDYNPLIIIHDSLLPRFRGFAPLVGQLIAGNTRIGASAIVAADKFDTGDIIFQESIEISYPIKVQEAIKLMSGLYALLAIRVLNDLNKNKQLPRTVQNEKEVTYSIWRDEQDLIINWSHKADEVARFIDSIGYPYNGACTWLNNRKLTINDASVLKDVKLEQRHFGKSMFFEEGCPVVVCGQGLLKINDANWADTGEKVDKWPGFRLRFTNGSS